MANHTRRPSSTLLLLLTSQESPRRPWTPHCSHWLTRLMKRWHFAGIKLHHCGKLTMRGLKNENWGVALTPPQNFNLSRGERPHQDNQCEFSRRCTRAELLQTDHVMSCTYAVNMRNWYFFLFINLYDYCSWRNAFPHSPQTKSSSSVFQKQLCGVMVWNTSLRVHIFTPPKEKKKENGK